MRLFGQLLREEGGDRGKSTAQESPQADGGGAATAPEVAGVRRELRQRQPASKEIREDAISSSVDNERAHCPGVANAHYLCSAQGGSGAHATRLVHQEPTDEAHLLLSTSMSPTAAALPATTEAKRAWESGIALGGRLKSVWTKGVEAGQTREADPEHELRRDSILLSPQGMVKNIIQRSALNRATDVPEDLPFLPQRLPGYAFHAAPTGNTTVTQSRAPVTVADQLRDMIQDHVRESLPSEKNFQPSKEDDNEPHTVEIRAQRKEVDAAPQLGGFCKHSRVYVGPEGTSDDGRQKGLALGPKGTPEGTPRAQMEYVGQSADCSLFPQGLVASVSPVAGAQLAKPLPKDLDSAACAGPFIHAAFGGHGAVSNAASTGHFIQVVVVRNGAVAEPLMMSAQSACHLSGSQGMAARHAALELLAAKSSTTQLSGARLSESQKMLAAPTTQLGCQLVEPSLSSLGPSPPQLLGSHLIPASWLSRAALLTHTLPSSRQMAGSPMSAVHLSQPHLTLEEQTTLNTQLSLRRLQKAQLLRLAQVLDTSQRLSNPTPSFPPVLPAWPPFSSVGPQLSSLHLQTQTQGVTPDTPFPVFSALQMVSGVQSARDPPTATLSTRMVSFGCPDTAVQGNENFLGASTPAPFTPGLGAQFPSAALESGLLGLPFTVQAALPRCRLTKMGGPSATALHDMDVEGTLINEDPLPAAPATKTTAITAGAATAAAAHAKHDNRRAAPKRFLGQQGVPGVKTDPVTSPRTAASPRPGGDSMSPVPQDATGNAPGLVGASQNSPGGIHALGISVYKYGLSTRLRRGTSPGADPACAAEQAGLQVGFNLNHSYETIGILETAKTLQKKALMGTEGAKKRKHTLKEPGLEVQAPLEPDPSKDLMKSQRRKQDKGSSLISKPEKARCKPIPGGGPRAKGAEGHKGIRQRSWGRWVAEIQHPKKKARVWLGSFPTAEKAAEAYDKAELALYGQSGELENA